MLKAYFISDLHLGPMEDYRAQFFLKWLQSFTESSQITHLFLVGDIFDLWVADHHFFKNKYKSIIDEIIRLKSELKVEVHYFEGNHDLYLKKFWETELGFFVHPDYARFQLGPHLVHVEHGDRMDPEDRGYRFLRWFLRTPFMKFVAPRLPEQTIVNLGEAASAKSRKYTSEKKIITNEAALKKIRLYAEEVYKKNPYDFLIAGHFHFIDQYLIDEKVNKGLSINLGTWLEKPRAFLLQEDSYELLEL